MAKTMREDFEAAIEDLDAGEGLEETPQQVLVQTEETEKKEATGDEKKDDEKEQSSSGDPSDGKGPSSASASEGEPDSKKKDEKETEKKADDQAATGDEKETEKKHKEGDSIPAPLSWQPKEREQWSKVPRPLQERIKARELEIEQTIAYTKDARAVHEHFGKLAQSYAPVLAAEGIQHPLQAVEGLFSTVAKLRMGTPHQKAEEITRIIQQYGVDIPTLDNVLSGTPIGQGQPAQGQPNAQLEQLLDQRLAPVNQFMEAIDKLQNQQQSQGRQQAQESVKEFAAQAEFLADVREDMADIIDLAAKRGVTLTLEQAYDRACAAHPQISEILQKRANDKLIIEGKQTLEQKQQAASSLSGRQSGSGGANAPTSLRDQLSQAWDEQQAG